MSQSPHVVEVTEANFQTEVADHSKIAPVVVDFWASWCGPCKTLGPVLESLAEEYRGAFRLAKVDVDKAPQLAAYFQAQSIPMVIGLWDGQFVDKFVGALPAQQVRAWLEKLLATAGVEKPAAPAVDASMDTAAAEAFYKAKLQANAKDGESLLALAKLLLAAGRSEDAGRYLQLITAKMDEYAPAQAVIARQGLLDYVVEAGGEEAARAALAADPTDAAARFAVAVADGVAARYTTSLEVLVELVGSGPQEVRPKAKDAAKVLFNAAGRDDPDVEALRRKLTRLLF